eukprot:g12997.t1
MYAMGPVLVLFAWALFLAVAYIFFVDILPLHNMPILEFP